MFLYQKFKYNTTELKEYDDVAKMIDCYKNGETKYTGFDTETNGLETVVSLPFLIVFGFRKHLYALDLTEPEKPFTRYALYAMYDLASRSPRLFAHNMQYDMNMMENYGAPLPESINLADSTVVFRLTTYVDDLKQRSLKAIGKDIVDEDSDYAEKVIKSRLNRINADRKTIAEQHFAEIYKDELKEDKRLWRKVWEAYLKERVQFVKHEYDSYFEELDKVYERANYQSVYEQDRELMVAYAFDDLVLMFEYLEKALPVLMQVDPGLKTFNRESKMLRVTQRQERTGLKVDIDYMLESRLRMQKYRSEKYEEFHKLIGEDISVGQHKRIRELFASNWGMFLPKADKDTFENLSNSHPMAKKTADVIVILRTVDKWLSTYIDGMLNRVVDGRVYTTIDNTGAKTGRVSSNLQQQPGDGFYDDNGVELFHPRRPFIPDDGYKLYSLDYSQHELRVQAYWTIVVGGGDLNLCRAYMPFNCKHKPTGEQFDFTNPKMLAMFGTERWIENDTGKEWKPVDLHSVTTANAFPEINEDSPEFKEHRHLGKMANFLKNYGGGMSALQKSLNVEQDIAQALDDAYYTSYPKIKEYQAWVNTKVSKYGYVENLYGRRYYLRNLRYSYRLYNYLVQGSCADMLKEVQIELDTLLLDYDSYVAMPIHDEVLVLVKDGEEFIVDKIMEIMTKQPKEIPYVPMKVGAESSRENWRDMTED